MCSDWLVMHCSRSIALRPYAPIIADWLPPWGAEGALRGNIKSCTLLQSPPDTTSGAHTEWVDILGADGAAAAILKIPSVLRSPADTVKGAHKAFVGILGADRAAEAILQSP